MYKNWRRISFSALLMINSLVVFAQNKPIITVDPNASTQTKALFFNLKSMAGKGVLFGQQDALMYGIGWKGENDKSDVKLVTGSHPALFGWDLESVGKNTHKREAEINTEKIKKLCIDAYNMGGINTLSWHVQNFLTDKNFYDTTLCVPAILPGGEKHSDYIRALDKIALFIKSLKTANGQEIPVIFRPFHEHTGNWFWWGKPFCTVEEYKQLWRFTVQYLRNSKQLHNILYAYSPDRISGNFENYLERYPGNDYVDILGFDNYYELKDISDVKSMSIAVNSLSQIADYAIANHKIVALTETGQEKIVQSNWYTAMFNKLMSDPSASKISYLMVWRNAHTNHFYASYPGHSSERDFKDFYNHPKSIFLNDLDMNMYQINNK